MEQLRPWEEIIGTLQATSKVSDSVEVTINGVSILLEDEAQENLKHLIGEEISILRTDVNYRVRVEGNK